MKTQTGNSGNDPEVDRIEDEEKDVLLMSSCNGDETVYRVAAGQRVVCETVNQDVASKIFDYLLQKGWKYG